MSERIGPTVSISVKCYGCKHCKTKGYYNQGDSGSEVYCDHSGVLVYIGDTCWDTPEWCPFRAAAIRASSPAGEGGEGAPPPPSGRPE